MVRKRTRLVCGVGVNDYPNTIKINGKCIKSYKIWIAMISRCYNKKDKSYHRYGGRGIRVSDDWLYFSNFKKWYDENYRYDLESIGIGIELDKDLINKNSKIYSSETCIFLPYKINIFISNVKSTNTSGYIGVYWFKRDSVWKAQITDFETNKTKHLGYFEDIVEASKAYKLAREIEAIKAREYMRKLGYNEVIISKIK